MDALERRHALRHPLDWARMRWRHWRRTRRYGLRVIEGGMPGVTIPCPTCDGDGVLHQPDEPPELHEPQWAPVRAADPARDLDADPEPPL